MIGKWTITAMTLENWRKRKKWLEEAEGARTVIKWDRERASGRGYKV